MSNITFINQVPAIARLPRAVICRTLRQAERRYGARLRAKRLSLVFVSAADIKRLNKRYRDQNKPTNVLSFTTAGRAELGDIIICPAIARAEATALSQAFVARTNYLFTHGLLHLLGFDHHDDKSEGEMLKAEQELIKN